MPSDSNGSAGSVVDDLLRCARDRPSAPALVFLGDGEHETERLTYAELTDAVCRLAGRLQANGLAGRPVVVALPAGVDYIVAVLACMFAGAWAVPMPEPPASRGRARWDSVMSHLQPAALIAAAPVEGVAQFVPVRAPSDACWTPPALDPGAVAFIQYTSGSTASPKGVVVTQGALSANRAMIRESFGHDPSWRCVTWLPPYHDMGLVGGLLQPLGEGMEVVILPPLAVVQRPLRWLKAISRYRATVSGGPCFGYAACVERISPEDRALLDLSCWSLAYCGAEPVRADVLQAFAATFEGAGFGGAALYPCYGLAEATLFVTGSNRGRGLRTLSVDRRALARSGRAEPQPEPAAARRLTACGWAWGGGEVRICDPETGAPLPDRHVGEIRVRGRHLAAGYYRAEAETAAAFGGGELRTGDLAFIDDGDLYVVGRLKDVIIVRGVKHHAEDLEAALHGVHPALTDGAGVAFAANGEGEERLVLGHEIGRAWLRQVDPREVEAAISDRVLAHYGVRPDVVVALRPGSLPRTSSGKVQRHLCRRDFELGLWRTDRMVAGPRPPAEPARHPDPDGRS